MAWPSRCARWRPRRATWPCLAPTKRWLRLPRLRPANERRHHARRGRMRSVIWLVLLFAAAVVAATVLGPNDALVSVFYGTWRMDLSLNLFLLVLLASIFIVFAAMQAMQALLSLPTRAREWREQKRERAAGAALREAFAELFAARYARAQRAAQRALDLQAL